MLGLPLRLLELEGLASVGSVLFGGDGRSMPSEENVRSVSFLFLPMVYKDLGFLDGVVASNIDI